MEIEEELATNTLLQSRPDLRMFAWIVKGDIDSETFTASMREDWEHVRQLAQQLGDAKWENRADAQLGLAAFYDGDTEAAALKVATAVQTARQLGDIGAQIRYLSAMGLGMTGSRMFEQAQSFFESALNLARATPESGYPYLTQQGRIAALIGLKRFEEAESSIQDMLSNARRQQRSTQEATALALQASLQKATGNPGAALAAIQQAMTIAEAAGMYRSLAEMQDIVASTAAAAGDLKTARTFAERAVAATQTSGDAWSVPQRLKTWADLLLRSGDREKALETYAQAEVYVDALMGKAPTVLQKTALLKAASDLYSQHFTAVADILNNPDTAFSVIEQVRGRVTTEILLEGTATHPQAAVAEREVAKLRLRLMGVRTTQEIQRLRDEIFAAEQARWTAPGVSILRSTANVRIDLRRLQSVMSDSEIILEFVLANPRSYCLAIQRSSARIISLPPKDRLEKLIADYISAVRSRREAKAEAQALYRALLQPMALSARHTTMTVVRDGDLFLLPIDALVTPSGRYLLETRTVQYAFSASSVYLQRRALRAAAINGRPLLAVGAVPYAGSGLGRGMLTRSGRVEKLPDLPSSAEELRATRDALPNSPATLLSGHRATETAFKRSGLSQFGVIHLAVHGLADPTFADRGALILLSDPAAGEDGYLQSAEIAQLHLDGPTVVLSACDTAVGPLLGQEGISNIARAFLIAGARNVVSSVWAVDDNSSLFLMKRLYAHLAAGKPVARALNAAKRDMITKFKDNAAPYLWAGFTADSADPVLRPNSSQLRSRAAEVRR